MLINLTTENEFLINELIKEEKDIKLKEIRDSYRILSKELNLNMV